MKMIIFVLMLINHNIFCSQASEESFRYSIHTADNNGERCQNELTCIQKINIEKEDSQKSYRYSDAEKSLLSSILVDFSCNNQQNHNLMISFAIKQLDDQVDVDQRIKGNQPPFKYILDKSLGEIGEDLSIQSDRLYPDTSRCEFGADMSTAEIMLRVARANPDVYRICFSLPSGEQRIRLIENEPLSFK